MEYSIKKNEMGRVAFLYAHSAFLSRNLCAADLSRPVVATFLSSQLFLATRFLCVCVCVCVCEGERERERERESV